MSFVVSKSWLECRARADVTVGAVVDEFVQGNYHAVVGMCDFHLASSMVPELENTFLVSSCRFLEFALRFL